MTLKQLKYEILFIGTYFLPQDWLKKKKKSLCYSNSLYIYDLSLYIYQCLYTVVIAYLALSYSDAL